MYIIIFLRHVKITSSQSQALLQYKMWGSTPQFTYDNYGPARTYAKCSYITDGTEFTLVNAKTHFLTNLWTSPLCALTIL